MREALELYERLPKWVVYLIVLIVPGALLIAPLVAVGMQRYRRTSQTI